MKFSLRVHGTAVLALATCFACVTAPETKLVENREQLSLTLSEPNRTLLGLTLAFDKLPDDLAWEVEVLLRSSDDQIVTLRAPNESIAAHIETGAVPVMFSLPPGRYTFEGLALIFPKEKNDLYRLNQDRVTLKTSKAIPTLRLHPRALTHLGLVRFESGDIVPGRDHITNLNARWVPTAPVEGKIWSPIVESLPMSSLSGFDKNDDTSYAQRPARLVYFQTTEENLNLFQSGFGRSSALAILTTDRDGFSFFRQSSGKIFRVQAKKFGNSFVHAFPANLKDSVMLMGVCLPAQDEECPYETLRLESLPNQEEFKPAEARYVGNLTTAPDSKGMVINYLLPTDVEDGLKSQIPLARFRSFTLGEEPARKEISGSVFVDQKGPKESWESRSQKLLRTLSPRVQECQRELRRIDPMMSWDFQIWFEKNAQGKMQIQNAKSNGLEGPGYEFLNLCFQPEFNQWNMNDDADIYKGFGIKFQ